MKPLKLLPDSKDTGGGYSLIQVPEFRVKAISESSYCASDSERAILKNVHPALRRGIKQAVKGMNKGDTGYYRNLNQDDFGTYVLGFGRKVIETIDGLGELRSIDDEISRYPYKESMLLGWEKSASLNIGGGDRWDTRVREQDKQWYSALASDLHISRSLVYQVGIEWILMTAPCELISQKYRDIYYEHVVEFGKWVKERINFGKQLLLMMKAGEQPTREHQYVLSDVFTALREEMN